MTDDTAFSRLLKSGAIRPVAVHGTATPQPKVATSPLAYAVGDFLSLGYHVVPIMPNQKRPGEYVAGRWKAMDSWQRYRLHKPTPFELGNWAKWPNANVGIVLGSPTGDGTVLIAIDLDMRDAAQVAKVVAALPKTPMSKTGAKGETLFFRASPDVKTRVFDKVLDDLDDKGRRKRERLADFLTGNQTRQTVAPPSQHPDGFAYRWLRGPVPAHQLPLFDDAALAKFEAAMRALGWSSDPQSSAPAGVVRSTKPKPDPAAANVVDFSASVHKQLNSAALSALDDWVPELDLYRCRKARNGYEAVATWRASSTGRPDEKRKLNLSIQPSGIKDFGTETSYSPIDLVMCAKGLSLKDAYEWLRSFITPLDETGVMLAFDPCAKTKAPHDPESAGADTPSMSGDNPDDVMPAPLKAPDLVPSFFDSDADMGEWPDDLCFPVGLVGQVAQWIDATAVSPCPLLAYGAALTLVGTVAGRQFKGPTGTGTHLYVIGAAPTGVGKDHPMQCVAIALNDANMSMLIGPPDYTADSAVLRHLLDHPLSVSLMDEFGSFWKRINGKKSGTWETAITRALREPWGRSFRLMRTKQYAGAGPASQDIWWPALSILGMTTPGEFFNALSATDIENGMANRLLVLATARRGENRRTRAEIKAAYFSGAQVTLSTPKHVVDGLKAIQNWQGEVIGPQFGWSATTRPDHPTVDCTIDDAAAELLFSYRQWISERTDEDDSFGNFYSRGAESAQRIAMIHAIGRASDPGFDKSKPPQIEYDDVHRAVRLVDWSLRRMWAAVADHHQATSVEEVARRIVDALRRRGPLSHRDLRRALGASAYSAFGDAVRYLQETEIIEVEIVAGGKGRRPTMYRLRDLSAYRS